MGSRHSPVLPPTPRSPRRCWRRGDLRPGSPARVLDLPASILFSEMGSSQFAVLSSGARTSRGTEEERASKTTLQRTSRVGTRAEGEDERRSHEGLSPDDSGEWALTTVRLRGP